MLELVSAGTLPFHNIDPILFEWGFVVIRWYSLAYIGGLMFAWWYLAKMGDEKKSPFTRAHIDDFVMWATFGVIFGGRLGYVLFYNPSYYASNPGDILRLWDGGMSFHGGLGGVMLAVIAFAYKYKINLFQFADRIAVVSPMGLFFGRVSNFINGELWGAPSELPWAMVFPGGGDVARHPSQLYEGLLEGLLLFLILNWLYTKTPIKNQVGMLTGVFFIGYGMARYGLEFVRVPDAHLGLLGGIMSMGQLLSLPMIGFGLWLIVRAAKNAAKGAAPNKQA